MGKNLTSIHECISTPNLLLSDLDWRSCLFKWANYGSKYFYSNKVGFLEILASIFKLSHNPRVFRRNKKT